MRSLTHVCKFRRYRETNVGFNFVWLGRNTGGGKNSTRVDNYMYNYHRRLNDLDLRVARECEIERIQEARLTSKSQKRFDHNDIL